MKNDFTVRLDDERYEFLRLYKYKTRRNYADAVRQGLDLLKEKEKDVRRDSK